MKLWKRPLLTTVLWATAFGAGYLGYDYSQNTQFAQAQEKREEVRKGLAHAEDLATAFRDVGRVVGPSVVNINVRKKVPVARRSPMEEEMFRRFFRDRGGNGGGGGGEEGDGPEGFAVPGPFGDGGGFEQIGTGSGVILEVSGKKGYILTNNHVAGGAEEILITLADGRQIKNGKLVGADAKTDLAVVVIEADRLVPSKWGSSDELQKGDWVMAFGSPFGYVGSMTHGIVSAINRNDVGILGQGGYESFIQVDAPINPGNSGGPLVNLRGEVVGINTAIASRSGGFQGIGFAIPSSQAKVIYSALKEKGKVVRGWLGVGIHDVSKDLPLAKSFGWEEENGVFVDQIFPDTPAFGKLERGDIIAQINGKPVNDVQRLRASIALLPPGAKVEMKVFRKNKETTINVTLGEQPENVAAVRTGKGQPGKDGTGDSDALGIRVQSLTSDMADKMGLDVKDGAIITRVERNSLAGRAGLRSGDVINEVGNTTVHNADEFAAAMKKVDVKKGVRLYVTSREGSRYMFVAAE